MLYCAESFSYVIWSWRPMCLLITARWGCCGQGTPSSSPTEISRAFVLQDSDCLWHQYSWRVFGLETPCWWMSSTTGGCISWFRIHDDISFFATKTECLRVDFARTCHDNLLPRSWLQRICMEMNGVFVIYFEVMNYEFELLFVLPWSPHGYKWGLCVLRYSFDLSIKQTHIHSLLL